jgi:hypothetical protein
MRKKQNSSFLIGIFIEEDEREIVACVQKQKQEQRKNDIRAERYL